MVHKNIIIAHGNGSNSQHFWRVFQFQLSRVGTFFTLRWCCKINCEREPCVAWQGCFASKRVLPTADASRGGPPNAGGTGCCAAARRGNPEAVGAARRARRAFVSLNSRFESNKEEETITWRGLAGCEAAAPPSNWPASNSLQGVYTLPPLEARYGSI